MTAAALDGVPAEAGAATQAKRRELDQALGRSRECEIHSMASLRALLLLAEKGDVYLTLVARHVAVSTAAITGMMDRLEAQGHVERFREPGDRRAVRVRLTAKGAETLNTILVP